LKSRLAKFVEALMGASLLFALGVVSVRADEQDESVDVEMLEFIGEWEAADGTWVDPMAMQQELQTSQQKNSAVNEDTKDESR